jgi:hypothetical protein
MVLSDVSAELASSFLSTREKFSEKIETEIGSFKTMRLSITSNLPVRSMSHVKDLSFKLSYDILLIDLRLFGTSAK